MPDYDIFDVYNFEDQIEPAMKAPFTVYLSLAGLRNVQVVTTREGEVKATPRVELSFALNQAQSQRTTAGQTGPNKKQVPNSFIGIVTATVVTTRAIKVENGPDHGRIVGVSRYLLSAASHIFNAESLPWMQVLDLLPEGQSPRVMDGKGQDITQLNYRIWFAVNNSAWKPAPTPVDNP